jgi:hypothetical protein
MLLTSPVRRSAVDGSDLRVDLHPGAPPVVEVGGEIDIESAPWLRDELLRVVRRHGPRVAGRCSRAAGCA